VTLLLQMTRIALPAMKANRKGTIVNIGSASGSLVPATPLTSVYAGTKVRLVHKLAGKQRAMVTMCSEAYMCDDIARHSFYCLQSKQFLVELAVQHKVGCDNPVCMQLCFV